MKDLIANVRPPDKKKKKGDKDKSYFDTSITRAIDSHLRNQNGSYWKNSKSFAPSGNNLCPRFLNYRLIGYEHVSKFPARTYRIFSNGDYVHDRLTSYFDGMGILIESEREFWTTDPVIHGFIDALIWWEGKEVVVEFKSISEYGFRDINIFKKAKEDHIRQIQIYLWATGLDHGFIIYENKNNQQLIAIEVEKDLSVIDPILDLYRKVWKFNSDGKIPARPFEEDSKNCENCNAKKFCWSDDREGVEFD